MVLVQFAATLAMRLSAELICQTRSIEGFGSISVDENETRICVDVCGRGILRVKVPAQCASDLCDALGDCVEGRDHVAGCAGAAAAGGDHGAIQGIPAPADFIAAAEASCVCPGSGFEFCVVAVDVEEIRVLEREGVVDVFDEDGAC